MKKNPLNDDVYRLPKCYSELIHKFVVNTRKFLHIQQYTRGNKHVHENQFTISKSILCPSFRRCLMSKEKKYIIKDRISLITMNSPLSMVLRFQRFSFLDFDQPQTTRCEVRPSISNLYY